MNKKSPPASLPFDDESWSIAIHDLKSPLTNIKIFSELVRKKIETDHAPELEKYLEKILNKTDYLVNLINDFSDIYRLRSHNLKLETEVVGIDLLVKEAALYLNTHFKDLNFTPQIETTKKVNYNPNRFVQTVNGYVQSVIKSSPDCREINIHICDKGSHVVGLIYECNCEDLALIKKIDNAFSSFPKIYTLKTDQNINSLAAQELINSQGGKTAVLKGPKGLIFCFSLPAVI